MKARFKHGHLPVRSFFCKRLYRDVSSRWTGGNLLYLCLLLAVCLIPVSHQRGRRVKALIDEKAAIYLMQIPPMRLEDGKLTVDAPQPYSIIEDNETVLLIDTTGRIKTLDQAHALALLTETRLILHRNGEADRVYDLSEFKSMSFSRDIAAAVVERAKKVITPAWFVVAYVVSVALFLGAAFLLGGIALALASWRDRRLDYWAGVRLAVVALTPPILLAATLEVAGLRVLFLAHAALALAYLLVAVSAAQKKRPPAASVEDEVPTSDQSNIVTFPVSEDRPYRAKALPED